MCSRLLYHMDCLLMISGCFGRRVGGHRTLGPTSISNGRNWHPAVSTVTKAPNEAFRPQFIDYTQNHQSRASKVLHVECDTIKIG